MKLHFSGSQRKRCRIRDERGLESVDPRGREATGKPRNRIYVYQEYLDILNSDTPQQELAADAHRPLLP